MNRNKRSLALNLKAPEGQAIFKRLATTADVIVEGFRPGVMKRLGADYESIKARNPRVIYCSLSGFGHNGPYRDFPAHDGNYLSLAGILGLIGEPDRKPVFPLNLVADYAGASMHGALGIMLALFARENTGRGQHVDVSYLDTSVALLAATPNMRFFWSDGLAPKRGEGFLGGSYPYYAVYETSRREAPDHRVHGALALGQLLQGHRSSRLRQVLAAAGPVRPRGQPGGGALPRGDRGHHPDAHPRRMVRLS